MRNKNIKPKGKIFYGWIIVGATFLIMSVVYSIWFSFPLFYVSILNEFGWTRAKTALIFSIGSITYGIGSALAGALLDRFGPKKTFTGATVIMVIGLVGCSRITETWQFFIFWGGFASFGICMAGFVPCVTLVSNWFIKRRATTVGIAQAGGRESFVMTPLIQGLILTLGWRNAYLVLAIAASVLILSSAQLLQSSPANMGLLPDGDAEPEEKDKGRQSQEDKLLLNKQWTATDWTLSRGMKEYRFWALFGIMLTLSISYGIVMIHQVAFIVDIGFTAMFASFLLVIYGISGVAGRLCGFISDSIGREYTFTLGCGGVIVGILMLMLARGTSNTCLLYIYAVFFGFFSGLNSPTYASAAADIFQGKHFGAILGFANIGYGMGSAIGAWFGGYIFDTLGSYTPAFALGMLMLGLACISLWISSPRKIRLVAGKAHNSQMSSFTLSSTSKE